MYPKAILAQWKLGPMKLGPRKVSHNQEAHASQSIILDTRGAVLNYIILIQYTYKL